MQVRVWFKGIRVKLLMLSGIPLVFIIAISLFGRNSITDLEQSLTKANLVRAPLITYSGEMLLHASSIARWMVSAMWSFEDKQSREVALKNAEASIQEFEKVMEAYVNMPRSDRAKQVFKVVQDTWPILKSSLDEIIPILAEGSPEKKKVAEELYVRNVRPRVAIVVDTIQDLNAARKTMMEEELKTEKEETTRTLLLMNICSLAAILITLAFMFVVLKHLMSSLESVTDNLSAAAEALASASEELSASSTEVASGSAETASAIQETVASIEEINSMVKTTDANSQSSLDLSHDTQKQAEQSEKKLTELVVSLKEISTSSEKITAIIQVIDDISFQTNLLALNAAVEAARAGEQGKGFAVVAEAVRALAQKSASSAKEIGDLIRESVEKTKTGVGIGSECKDLMGKMFDSLKKVSVKSEEIAHSSREQSAGMEQISKAMNQLDMATQQNSAASEQISGASNELSSQATSLNTTVEHLKALVDGQAGSVPVYQKPITFAKAQSFENAKPSRSSKGVNIVLDSNSDLELPRVV